MRFASQVYETFESHLVFAIQSEQKIEYYWPTNALKTPEIITINISSLRL